MATLQPVPNSRRAEALVLAEELLTDIESSRISPPDLAKKASRLARLLDDPDAIQWLAFEVGGYTPKTQGDMSNDEVIAASRSRRIQSVDSETGYVTYNVTSLSGLQAHADGCTSALAALTGAPSSSDAALLVERERAQFRNGLIAAARDTRQTIDAVIGAIHSYASARYQELRFGSAVEGAFDQLRADVDRTIATLVPNALTRLNAAFENATSENPEHWANAASTCRRLLKEVADAVRPPGPDVDGHRMGDENYVNRLVDWITTQSGTSTAAESAITDVQYLGRRLDAVANAGHKGAHAEVSRFDASRFLVGTYVLLGDILRLAASSSPAPATQRAASVEAELPDPPPSMESPEVPGTEEQISRS